MRGLMAALGAVLVCGAAALAGFEPAEAKETEEFNIGQWTGFSYTNDDTGQFTDCTVWAFNRNNVQLGVSVKKDWSLELWLNSKSWNLPANQSYAISYWIDRNRQYTGRAETSSDKYVVIAAEYDQDVFNELQNGSQVTFRAQNEDYIFDLSQSRAALNRLLNCVDQYSKQASANPFGGGEAQQGGGGQGAQPFGDSQGQPNDSQQQEASSGDQGSVRLKELTLTTDDVRRFLVDVTGAKPSMVSAESKTSKLGNPYYAFSTPIGAGQFWQEHLGNDTLRGVADFYMNAYKEECESDFNQTVQDPVQGDRGAMIVASATCSNSPYQNGGAEVLSYILTVTSGDVISTYVTYVGGNAAKAKTDSLGRLIARRQESDIK
ncbi:hypothetical protein [Dongia sp. agr-C8]